jgi:hypothetical protein
MKQNLFVEEAFLASSRSLSLFSLMLCLINFSDTLTGIGASGSSPKYSPSCPAVFLRDRERPLPSQLSGQVAGGGEVLDMTWIKPG